jgi:hypothetical protein
VVERNFLFNVTVTISVFFFFFKVTGDFERKNNSALRFVVAVSSQETSGEEREEEGQSDPVICGSHLEKKKPQALHAHQRAQREEGEGGTEEPEDAEKTKEEAEEEEEEEAEEPELLLSAEGEMRCGCAAGCRGSAVSGSSLCASATVASCCSWPACCTWSISGSPT